MDKPLVGPIGPTRGDGRVYGGVTRLGEVCHKPVVLCRVMDLQAANVELLALEQLDAVHGRLCC